MNDAVGQALTLEQLTILDAIEREGSFTAAARALRRTQGSVSYHVDRLEQQLGVALFDRTRRKPSFTAEGRAALGHARAVLARVQDLRAMASGWSTGVEVQLRLAVDALFPPARLAALVRTVQARHPGLEIRVTTGVVRFAAEAVSDGEADVAITGPLGTQELETRRLGEVRLLPVVAPHHPLAEGRHPASALERHVHLLLTDGHPGQSDPSIGFASALRWRLSDPRTRLELLRAGLGWARLPEWEARADLEDGRLVRLDATTEGARVSRIPILLATRPGQALGRAGRYVWDHADLPRARNPEV